MATTPHYEVDPTGNSIRNRKENELYTIGPTGKSTRALSPLMGCFFTKNIVIIDDETKEPLKAGTDFVFTEVYTSLSIIFKSEIAGTIVFNNPDISDKVRVTYNFLGSKYKDTLQGITAGITASQDAISPLQWKVLNDVKTFIPSDYAMQIGAGIGFETLVYGLERIRSSILYGDFNLDVTLGQHIDGFISIIDEVLRYKLNNELVDRIREFKARFTKELLGLDKVVNMGTIDPEKAKYAALRNYQFLEGENGYITTRAISRFKEELYNNLVNSEQTGLGKHYGIYGLPLLTTIYALRNGGGFIIDSLNTATVTGYTFNKVVFPDLTSPDDKWSIVKLTNNETGQGGTLWGTNLTTSEVYIGALKDSINDPNVLTWTKLYSEFDMERALDALTDHINDIDNPHRTNKHQMDLGNVENLPPADYEDLACRVPSDKYVTHKFFLGFMSTYMTGLKTAEDLKAMNCDENEVIRNIKLIFAPCGSCGPCCEPNIIPVVTTTTTIEPVDPGGQLTGWFCEAGKRWDILTDGFGGTNTVEHVYAFDDPAKEQDGCMLTTTSTTSTTSTPPPSLYVPMYATGFGVNTPTGLTFRLTGSWNEADFLQQYSDFQVSNRAIDDANTGTLIVPLKLFGLDNYDNLTFKVFAATDTNRNLPFANTDIWLANSNEVTASHALFGMTVTKTAERIINCTLPYKAGTSQSRNGDGILVIYQNNTPRYAFPVASATGTSSEPGIDVLRSFIAMVWFTGFSATPLAKWQAYHPDYI